MTKGMWVWATTDLGSLIGQPRRDGFIQGLQPGLDLATLALQPEGAAGLQPALALPCEERRRIAHAIGQRLELQHRAPRCLQARHGRAVAAARAGADVPVITSPTTEGSVPTASLFA